MTSKRFPSGLLVVGLLALSGLMWAVMFFGPLAHLARLASGLAPFDISSEATATMRPAHFLKQSAVKAAHTTSVQS
jgi:hypothetical protein